MKPNEIARMLELIDKLLEENQKDQISSTTTRELIHTNVSNLRLKFELNQRTTPSEYGKPLGLGLSKGIGEYNVSDEVTDAVYAIENYFETL